MKIKHVKTFQARILICVLFVGVLVLYLFLQKNVPNHLMINEIAFSHEDGIDWIEIYNPTMNNLSLEGFYLSDNAKDFTKFKIGEQIVVPSKGFAVIYCDDYEGSLNNSEVTNFRIANGETIYLISSDGSTTIDSMTVVGEDNKEGSIGRFPDGNEDTFIMSVSTPGETNRKD